MSVRLLAAVRINISLVHGRARSTRGPRRSGPAAVGDHQSRDQRHRSDAISHEIGRANLPSERTRTRHARLW